jgi:hypothetical protein
MRTKTELRSELAALLDARSERDRTKIVTLVWVLNSGWTWDTANEIAAKLLQAARHQPGAEHTPLQAFLDNLMSDDPIITN